MGLLRDILDICVYSVIFYLILHGITGEFVCKEVVLPNIYSCAIDLRRF